jgi:hypothetical protein
MKSVPKRCKHLVLITLLVLLSSALFADDGQAWLNNSVTFKIDSHLSLKLTQEARYNEVMYMDSYLHNWQGGFVYKLPKNFYAAFLYKREHTEKSDFTLAENRFTLESGWKTKVDKDLDFDCRFRTEIRRYDENLSENHLRFRLRVRLKGKINIGSLQLKPFIATEPFADTINDSIFRNRFYLGTTFPVSKKVEFVVNYIRQDTKDKDTIHILNSGIDLKF